MGEATTWHDEKEMEDDKADDKNAKTSEADSDEEDAGEREHYLPRRMGDRALGMFPPWGRWLSPFPPPRPFRGLSHVHVECSTLPSSLHLPVHFSARILIHIPY